MSFYKKVVSAFCAITVLLTGFLFGCEKKGLAVSNYTATFEFESKPYFDGAVTLKGKELSPDDYTVDLSDVNTKKTGEYTVYVTHNNTGESLSLKVSVVPKSKLKLLMIGNSFSVDTLEYAYPIAKSAGISEIDLGNLYIGGCDIDMHQYYLQHSSPLYVFFRANKDTEGLLLSTNDYKINDAIIATDWDIISFQQASPLSGIPSSYKNLYNFINQVMALSTNKAVKPCFNMTWAYAQDCTNNNFANYKNDQLYMYNAIVKAVNTVVVPSGITLIPTGTAIQNARTSYLGDTLSRDGRHLIYDSGRYTASLMLVARLTGINVDDVTFRPEGITDRADAAIKQAVKDALNTPLAITPATDAVL